MNKYLSKKYIYKIIKSLKDVDIKIFRLTTSWLFHNRLKIYYVVSLLLIREFILRIPYLNIIFIVNLSLVNSLIAALAVSIIVGFSTRKLIYASLLLFVPIAVLSLIKNIVIAEQIANVLYMLLLVSILGMIINLVKTNE